MIHCRQARPEEVALLIDWAAAEGWNPGLDDASVFRAADPAGFLVACQEDDAPVAGISVIKQGTTAHGDPYGFLGLYICLPAHRGSGCGWQVWQAGMQYLEGYTVALDGVVEQQANYRKSGFEFAWRNVRFMGSATEVANRQAADDSSIRCRLAEPRDIAVLVGLDEQSGGVRRETYLSGWFANTDHRTTVLVERHRQGEKPELLGCGTIRQCLSGHKIGPLLCVEPGVADALVCALVEHSVASEVTLDVPEINPAGMAFAASLGLKPVFETARMYRGKPPTPVIEQVFGMASLELG